MGNLGQREKYGLGLVAILIIAFIIYFAGIRNLQFERDDLELQRQQLEDQIHRLDAMKANNDLIDAQIREIDGTISDLEMTFIPQLNTECIEQFVQDTFLTSGCPYLNYIKSDNLTTDPVILPNGGTAAESLRVLRVTVQYATNDGFNFAQFNENPDYSAEYPTLEEFMEFIDTQYNLQAPEIPYDANLPMVEYNNFVAALKRIENTGLPANGGEDAVSTCVKINSISMESEGGYMLLTAEIDFYSAVFANRVSTPDYSAVYVTWSGATNIPVAPRAMGERLYFADTGSHWDGVLMTTEDIIENDRPFAAYWSNAVFDELVKTNGVALVIIGEEGLEDVFGLTGETQEEEVVEEGAEVPEA